MLNFIGGWGDQTRRLEPDRHGPVAAQPGAVFQEPQLCQDGPELPLDAADGHRPGNIQGAWTPGVGPNNLPDAPYLPGGVGSNHGSLLAVNGQCGNVRNVRDSMAN